MSSFLYTSVDYFHSPSANSSSSSGGGFEEYWSTDYVPLYLVVIVFPLLNFKSLQFFTKFNSLGS